MISPFERNQQRQRNQHNASTGRSGLFDRPFNSVAGLGLTVVLLLAIAGCASNAAPSDVVSGAEALTEHAVIDATDHRASTEDASLVLNPMLDAAMAETTSDDAAIDANGSAEQASFTPVVFNNDFSESVQPIFVESCAACHAEGGPGSPHWVLGNAQDLVDTHLLISSVLDTGYMPPWPASDEGVPLKDVRSLRPDQVQAILDWSAAGAPLDVDATTPVPPANGMNRLPNPDAIIDPLAPYAGDPANADDYRCQVYDPQLTQTQWVTGYEFVPDQEDVVHHAIGYLVAGIEMESALNRNGESGRSGWECYGGSGLGNDEIIIGWAPGQDASQFPEGTGLRMSPGDFWVIQVHYHYEGGAPADASQLALTYVDANSDEGRDMKELTVSQMIAPAEIPCAEWESGPLCDRDASYADARNRFGGDGVLANVALSLCDARPEDYAHFTQGTAESSCDVPAQALGATGEIVALLGHMHEIGDWFRMTLNPGTVDEQVLLDIPDWDFDWQYNYEPVDRIVISPNDVIRIECGWDRSLGDPTLEPRYIVWADGTNDEMCFANITTLR